MLLFLLASSFAADLTVGPTGDHATLDAAFLAARDGDRILVEAGTYVEPSLFVGGKALTVESIAGGVELRSSGAERLFMVTGGDLVVTGFVLDGEDTVGLAEVRAGRFELHDSEVRAVRAAPAKNGAGVMAVNSTIVLDNVVVDGAVTDADGAHVHGVNSTIELTASTFRGGSSAAGGVVAVRNGSAVLTDLVVLGNSAADGTVISAQNSDVVLARVGVDGNTATVGGLVACEGSGTCQLDEVSFLGNTVTGALVASRQTPMVVNAMVACDHTDAASLLTLEQGASAEVTGSAWLSNTTTGPMVQIDADTSAVMVNNTVVLQTPGTALIAADGDLTLVNNLIALHDGPEVAVQVRGAFEGGYNLYFDNAAGDVLPAAFASDVLGVDPMIGGPAWGDCDLDELRPKVGSPLVDGGDPERTDVDGSRSDIGAFGGEAPNPGTVLGDEDGDGFTAPLDCDDSDPDVNPNAVEIPCNGIDEDCDLLTPDAADADGDGVGVCDGDCDDTNARGTFVVEVYLDQDYDGFGVGEPTPFCVTPTNSAPADGDCDDSDPATYPGAPEVPYDGIDQDCDGDDLVDQDGDGALGPDDCDDLDPERYPGAEDIPDDGIDQDCTGADVHATLSSARGWPCGCQAGGAGGGGLAVVLALGLVRRRRASA